MTGKNDGYGSQTYHEVREERVGEGEAAVEIEGAPVLLALKWCAIYSTVQYNTTHMITNVTIQYMQDKNMETI